MAPKWIRDRLEKYEMRKNKKMCQIEGTWALLFTSTCFKNVNWYLYHLSYF